MTLRPDKYFPCGGCGAWKEGRVYYASRSTNRPVLKCLKMDCGFTTCMLCRTKWKLDHRCSSMVAPDWLPKYTSSCRIKQCPGCSFWIQLVDACNHMICSRCRYSFCFVCRIKRTGVHEGCVPYGDPEYDEEGYEVRPRGLHRYTGLNRQGLDRLGHATQLRDWKTQPTTSTILKLVFTIDPLYQWKKILLARNLTANPTPMRARVCKTAYGTTSMNGKTTPTWTSYKIASMPMVSSVGIAHRADEVAGRDIPLPTNALSVIDRANTSSDIAANATLVSAEFVYQPSTINTATRSSK